MKFKIGDKVKLSLEEQNIKTLININPNNINPLKLMTGKIKFIKEFSNKTMVYYVHWNNMRKTFPQFENQLISLSKKQNPLEKNKLLQAELDNWRGIHERVDDVLILGFQVV